MALFPQSVELLCSCHTPAHPNKTLVGCTNEGCKKWLHEDCIKEEALKATYNRLGTDKPHISPDTVKEEKDSEEAKRPLSPTETGAAVSAQHSIDVKADSETDAVHVQTNDSVDVKHSEDDEDAPHAPEDGITEPSSAEPQPQQRNLTTTTDSSADRNNRDTPNSKAVANNNNGTSSSKATPKSATKLTVRRGKKVSEANGDSSNGAGNGNGNNSKAKPWDGLFEVAFKLLPESNVPILEIKDLREGVVGGEKLWTEPVKCLLCGKQVN
jgi:hypothetical protein